MTKRVNVINNSTEYSRRISGVLERKLGEAGFTVCAGFDPGADLTLCVGGDGFLLDAIQDYGFPAMPIAGINTGHLGFFQDFTPERPDEFIEQYRNGDYLIQPLPLVEARVNTETGSFTHYGINEITLRGPHTNLIHLNISIDGHFLENFSGDGILVATPAGSTAYNYSLGGAIVDPRLKVLQVTPIAPTNSTAFRSMTSSVLLPADLSLTVAPQDAADADYIYVVYDGYEQLYKNIKDIEITLSDREIKLIRISDYDFWEKVKNKFI